jgi:RNA polymerase sigma factor (sigma-70 family)
MGPNGAPAHEPPAGGERLAAQPDSALLAAAQSDPEAFAELYRRLVDRVVAFTARRVSDATAVADIVAATFLIALETAGRYDPDRGEPVSWLLGITARLLANQRRRAFRESRALARLDVRALLDDDDIERLEAQIDAAAQAVSARRALASLPARQREALLLISDDGLSPAEAAQVLGISAATFRVRLARARRAVRLSMAASAAPPASPAITEGQTK